MKKLIMLSFVFLALSAQVEAATMSWVSAPTIDTNNSSTQIAAHKGYATAASSDTVSFIFNLTEETTVNSIGIEFFDDQLDITSVSLDSLNPFSFSSNSGIIGIWSLGNLFLTSGNHTIQVMVANALSGAQFNIKVNAVPVPAAIWLFGSALMGLIGFSRRKSGSAVAAV